MINTVLAAALLLAQQPGFSPPPARPCLTRVEAGDLALFVLPAFIEGAGRKCRPALSAGAFFDIGAGTLAQRLRSESGNRWTAARAAIEKLSGERLPTFFGEDMTRRMAEAAGATALIKEIDTEDCGKLDQALGALAPLPADNFARLLVLLIEAGAKEEPAKALFRLCPAEPA